MWGFVDPRERGRYSVLMLDPEEIKKLFLLARIEASEDELKTLPRELDAILEYVSVLQKAPAGDAPPTLSMAPPGGQLRPDKSELVDERTHDLLIKQFPETKDGYLKTKKVFGGE